MATAPAVMKQECLISLLFKADHLPHPADIFALADNDRSFFVSHDLRLDGDPAQALELLAAGLTFDCRWPDADPGTDVPDALGRHDVLPGLAMHDLQALRLLAGAHLHGGQAALPMAQEALTLAARFSGLPGFQAAVWHPARSWIGPAYLRSVAANWVEGGIFPAHGLVGLGSTADGAIQSEGLAFFIGQEIRIEAELLGDPGIAEKITARLADRLIGSTRVEAVAELAGPDGRMLRIAPSANGRVIRVWGGG